MTAIEKARQNLNFELLCLYYKLNGCGWNSSERIASFKTKMEAQQFKNQAPEWEVRIVRFRE